MPSTKTKNQLYNPAPSTPNPGPTTIFVTRRRSLLTFHYLQRLSERPVPVRGPYDIHAHQQGDDGLR